MRLRTQVIWSFALKGLGAALALAVSWGVARLYGSLGSGLYAIGQTTVQVIGFVAIIGLDSIMLRTMAREVRVDRRDLARGAVAVAVRVALPTALLMALLLLLLGPRLASAIAEPGAGLVLAIVSPAVVGIVAMRLGSFALRGAERPILSQVLEGPLTSGLAVIMLGGLALAPVLPPVWVLALVYTASMLITAAFGWIAWWRVVRHWPAAVRPPARPMLIAGVPVMISVVTGFGIDWLSIMLTSYFASPQAAGTLRVAAQTLLVTNLVVASFDAILGPRLAANWRMGEKAAIARAMRQTIIGCMAAASPLFILVLGWPELVMGLFGPEFVSGATALQIIAIGNLAALSSGPVGTLLIMSGHERWSIGFSLVGIAVLIGLSIWLVPIHGVTGAAIAVTSTIFARRILASLVVRYVVGIRIWDFGRGQPAGRPPAPPSDAD